MKKENVLKFGFLSLTVLALAVFAPSASAGVSGPLTFSACSGGAVAVDYSVIDFQMPVLLGYGCLDTGTPTSLTYANTATTTVTIGSAVAGTVHDLGYGSPATNNAGFITIGGALLNLITVGPGVSNLVCSTTLNPNNAACSVFAGSFFILAPTSSGTSISLDVSGLASDFTSSNSPWIGAFTTQISGQTPAQIQTTICGTADPGCTGRGGGTITASYSFSGQAGIPEPVSMALIGGGLIALAGLKLRKARS